MEQVKLKSKSQRHAKNGFNEETLRISITLSELGSERPGRTLTKHHYARVSFKHYRSSHISLMLTGNLDPSFNVPR